MIRGISRKIIEVNNTGSDFFERAVFYVKAGNEASDKHLKAEADRIICNYFEGYGTKHKKGYLRTKDEKKYKSRRLITCFVIGGLVVLSLIALIYFF